MIVNTTTSQLVYRPGSEPHRMPVVVDGNVLGYTDQFATGCEDLADALLDTFQRGYASGMLVDKDSDVRSHYRLYYRDYPITEAEWAARELADEPISENSTGYGYQAVATSSGKARRFRHRCGMFYTVQQDRLRKERAHCPTPQGGNNNDQ